MVFISFFCIAVAAISVTSLNHYIQKSDELLVNKAIYQQNEMENIIDQAESLFGTSSALMHQFWTNSLDEIVPYFIHGQKNPQRLNAIINNLKTAQFNFSNYGFCLAIFDPASDMVYSPGGTSSLEDLLANIHLDGSAATEIRAIHPEDQPLCYVTDNHILAYFQPWSNASDRNRLVECYQYDLDTLTSNNESIQLDDCGFWLSFEGTEIYSIRGENMPASFEAVGEKEHFVFGTRDSRFFDFSYSTASPLYTGLFLNSRLPKKHMVVVLVGMLILFLIFLLAKVLYHPIDILYRNALEIPCASRKSGKNELLLVADTLSDLKNTVDDLQETANRNDNLLREKKIRDLLLGLSKTEEIPKIVDELHLPFPDGKGSIILVEIRNTESIGIYELARTSEAVSEYLRKELGKFSTDDQKPILQTLSLRRLCILSAQKELDRLRTTAQSIKHEIQEDLNLELAMAIREIRDQETIPEVYDRALVLLQSTGNQRFNLLTEDQKDIATQNTSLIYSLDTEKELIKIIQGGNTGSIQALVSHIVSRNIKAKVPLSHLSQAFHTTVLRVVKNTGVCSDLAGFTEMIDTEDAIEFQEIIVKGLILLSQEIQKKDKNESATFSREIIDYVDRNYNKNISLTEVADYFQFSTVYMSTLFKNTTGINFKEYLTNIQVEQAKRFLETGEKIYNVSHQVGCNNVDTFIRMFKRVTGVSPGKYQQEYRNEKAKEGRVKAG
jgi:AraC-like DNA-binding protein